MGDWVWPNGSKNPPNLKPGGGTWADAPNSTPNADGLVCSSEFMDADHGGYHAGIDLIGFSTVRAAAIGEVIFAGWNGGHGNHVRVKHPGGEVTSYSHLASIGVTVGQQLGAGTPVGVMGTTGNSTGVHLHFETRLTEAHAPMNPREFMAARTADPTHEGDDDMSVTRLAVALRDDAGIANPFAPEYLDVLDWHVENARKVGVPQAIRGIRRAQGSQARAREEVRSKYMTIAHREPTVKELDDWAELFVDNGYVWLVKALDDRLNHR